MPVNSRATPKKMVATLMEMPGHARIATPSAMASTPDIRTDFQRCGNNVGAAGIVMPEVWHSTDSVGTFSQGTAAITRPHAQEVVNVSLSTVVHYFRYCFELRTRRSTAG